MKVKTTRGMTLHATYHIVSLQCFYCWLLRRGNIVSVRDAEVRHGVGRSRCRIFWLLAKTTTSARFARAVFFAARHPSLYMSLVGLMQIRGWIYPYKKQECRKRRPNSDVRVRRSMHTLNQSRPNPISYDLVSIHTNFQSDVDLSILFFRVKFTYSRRSTTPHHDALSTVAYECADAIAQQSAVGKFKGHAKVRSVQETCCECLLLCLFLSFPDAPPSPHFAPGVNLFTLYERADASTQ
jgi:hypothetical protein